MLVELELIERVGMQVLGGRVEELAEAWEFQKRFGNIDRPTAQTNPDDQEQPPPFHRFVPGRKGRAPPLAVRLTPPWHTPAGCLQWGLHQHHQCVIYHLYSQLLLYRQLERPPVLHCTVCFCSTLAQALLMI